MFRVFYSVHKPTPLWLQTMFQVFPSTSLVKCRQREALRTKAFETFRKTKTDGFLEPITGLAAAR